MKSLFLRHRKTARSSSKAVSAIAKAGCVALLVTGAGLAAQSPTGKVRRLVLEEQRIEGKIRRPQLVLIKADQRPDFGSIVVHSVGGDKDIAKAVSQSVIEKSPYRDAFRFAGKKIANFVP
ncbi:MAG: hypothetical protein GF331_17235 [Chitinivibrionales bacterium]|nr:hypothetical protein [Chitinivibrionales bacterium]